MEDMHQVRITLSNMTPSVGTPGQQRQRCNIGSEGESRKLQHWQQR